MTIMSSSDGSPWQKGLSSEQLNDLQDILRSPLTGRTILVPVGTKAFFPGTLQPTVDPNDQERVLVRVQNGSEIDVSRQEALDILQKEVDEEQGRKDPSKKVQKMKPSPSPQSSDTGKKLPPSDGFYFEIREELDESGETISGQVVDVTQQLEYLESNGETKSSAADSVPRGGDAGDEGYGRETIPEETFDPSPLSDQEYESLSMRLEELARLEEEAEQQKTSNRKSAKQLQSKGWSKGFLNSKPKQKKPKPPATQFSITQEKNQPLSQLQTGRKVAFQEENQVKEIPRVGERSVSEIRKPIESSVFSGLVQERPTGLRDQGNRDIVEERPTRRPASKPFDDSVLSGVVEERSAKTRSQPQEAPSKKRMSRFAQERQNHR